MNQPVIAMKLHPGEVKFNTLPNPLITQLSLPEGCLGMLFVFESKKAARAYWGRDVDLKRIEEIKENKL